MRVSVHSDRCVGSAQCVRAEPVVFDQSEHDGSVVLLLTRPPERMLATVRTARRTCPVQAIDIDENDGGLAAA